MSPILATHLLKFLRCCSRFNKPHYIAGGFDAHLASTGELIIPYITPCVQCHTSYFKETLKDWKPHKHSVHTTEEARLGGLASMSLFLASFASLEIIKYLAVLSTTNKIIRRVGSFSLMICL